TSSTASAAETFLTERLGGVPDDVILGDATVAASYGVDMSNFDNEGYVVRTVGDETLIFGKTEDGLDRAARYYANYVYGNPTPADKVYGEGARLDCLTVCGRTIEGFVITVTDEHPEGSYPESTEYASTELASLIKQATGVSVPVVKDVGDKPYIRLTCDGSGDNGEEGFTVTVTDDGNIEILGGLKRGCLYAVYDIAEKWLGMRFFAANYTYIYEQDRVNITPADSYSDAPLMDLRFPSSSSRNPGLTGFATGATFNVKNKLNGRFTDAKFGYAPLTGVSHGLYKYWNTDSAAENKCFTSDDVYYEVIENLEAELATAKENGNYDRGNYYHVNLGQNDNNRYCTCEDCLKVYVEEGAYSGVYARFVTRIADYFADDYPRAMFGMFAYWGTEVPCKSKLPDNVFVEYCITGHCHCGPMDGSECREGRRGLSRFTAAEERENLLGWFEITDNIDVRLYYFAENIAIPYNVFWYLREDTEYIYSLGVRRLYIEIEHTTFSYDHPATWVYSKLLWDPLMSEEEYDALVNEVMLHWYGDGYTYILDQLEYYDEIILCTDRFFWGGDIDYDRCAAVSDMILDCFDKAESLATSEFTEKNVRLLKAHALYNALSSWYDDLYVNGTAEERAKYQTRLTEIREIFEMSGATYIDFWKSAAIADIDWEGDPLEWYPGRTYGELIN
ncbi:MAG: DUF4838 domain-containing protein, partial [Ruminococcaceae bacterium]|nr:DUF4838 domain-containing protein [Oscillospiraceae bacterium]